MFSLMYEGHSENKGQLARKKNASTVNKLSYNQKITVHYITFLHIHCWNRSTDHSRAPTFVSPHNKRLAPVCSASFPPLISAPHCP